MDFLPVHKLPNISIGEHIEIKYNQLYNEEYDKSLNNGYLEDYQHFISETPKITKKNSLLFTREWILKASEEGIKIPNRRICFDFSIGEILELKYNEREFNKKERLSEKILSLKKQKTRKKM